MRAKASRALDQRDAPFGGSQGALEQRQECGILPRSVTRQHQVSDHDRQQVVEVVGDAAGQLPHSLEFLSLPQSGFGRPVFSDLGLQAEIGLIQLEAQPHGVAEEPVEMCSGQ